MDYVRSGVYLRSRKYIHLGPPTQRGYVFILDPPHYVFTLDPHTDSSDPMSIENDNSANNNNNGPTGAPTKRSNSEKGPRVRTVLSEQQLQTLKTVYASNPRPDALMKEHLVEITGLSPRVIRVWFQNKRCKDKKKMIQNEAVRMQQHQALQGSTNVSGVGLMGGWG